MARSKRLFCSISSLLITASMLLNAGLTAEAGSDKNYLSSLNGGVAAMLDSDSDEVDELMNATIEATALDVQDFKPQYDDTFVMTNVKSTLIVREEASERSKQVGKLYKDCAGTILEQQDGWTKIQSGNLIGWTKDKYLLYGEDARKAADEVGKIIATTKADALVIRMEPSVDATILGILAKGDIVEAMTIDENGWVCLDYNGKDGYVSSEYLELKFELGSGETMEEISARSRTRTNVIDENSRYKNFGEYNTDEENLKLLAAIIHCEAGGEPYEGQVAVGAVVMNRVRSAAYPDTIAGVIYAKGQFTPAMTGKLDRVLESGVIYESCYKAAQEALSGTSNVGDLCHFRRVDGREGLIIGNHVFH